MLLFVFLCGIATRRFVGLLPNAAHGEIWEEIVERKLREASALNKEHASISTSDVRRRLEFAATEGNTRVSEALRRSQGLAVVGEMKRKSPSLGPLASFSSAAAVAEELASWPVDAVSACVDRAYGGKPEDLVVCGVPTISKDVVVDPIQVAIAAEGGAQGVLLIGAVLGGRLEELMDTATLCGIEAVVEVHTPRETKFALSCGATVLFVNNRDRLTGELFPDQALGLRELIPPNIVTAACSGIDNIETARNLAVAGYDAVVLGQRIARPGARDFVASLRQLKTTPLEQTMPF